jgi:phosphoribosyl 1,2-cyclic phosphodiesterase
MTFSVTMLGCGFSGGVPRPGLGWGHCDPKNPKNRRRRCSILVERTGADDSRTRVLVDTSPDLREQLLDAGVDWVDGVLYTHEHADHTHGIDDLRTAISISRNCAPSCRPTWSPVTTGCGRRLRGRAARRWARAFGRPLRPEAREKRPVFHGRI